VTSTSDIPAETPGTAEDPASAKSACRAIGRAARNALRPHACVAAAEALAERLLALRELADARLVLVYSATAEELSLAPAVRALRERGVGIAFPRIEERGVLAVHLIDDEADLEPGPMGILEPSPDAPRPDVSDLDAVLVPGIAFDAHGVRVGFGGGFYDRLLPLVPQAVRIGVAFDEQIAQTLPLEPHDVVMDLVVTPTLTLRAGERP
jgi:5-formyltetrahydrofolate cyclo-ligase